MDVALGFLGVEPLAPEDAGARKGNVLEMVRRVRRLVPWLRTSVRGPRFRMSALSPVGIILRRGGSMHGEVRVQVEWLACMFSSFFGGTR